MALRATGLLPDGRAEREPRVMESRLRGADRDAERLGDLRERKFQEVVVDDDGSVVDRQVTQSLFERIVVGDARSFVGDRPIVIGQEPDIGLVAPLAPRLVPTGVHEQPPQPRIDPSWVPERGEIAPGADQGFLERVLGAAAIAEDERGGGEEPIDARRGKLREGVAVPIGCGCYQMVVGHGLLLPGTETVRLHGMAQPTADRFTQMWSGTIGR